MIWFGGFHYGLHITPKFGPRRMICFESLEETWKEAKLWLHNAEELSIVSSYGEDCVKVIYLMKTTRKLEKVESQ